MIQFTFSKCVLFQIFSSIFKLSFLNRQLFNYEESGYNFWSYLTLFDWPWTTTFNFPLLSIPSSLHLLSCTSLIGFAFWLSWLPPLNHFSCKIHHSKTNCLMFLCPYLHCYHSGQIHEPLHWQIYPQILIPPYHIMYSYPRIKSSLTGERMIPSYLILPYHILISLYNIISDRWAEGT